MKSIKILMTYLILFTIAGFVLSACADEQAETKSMEQIQEEKGIPVEVEAVTTQPFEKYISFYGKLEGFRQSTVGAMTGGRIEKVMIKAGDFVKKDQVVIEFPDDLPSSQVEQAKAAYENSKRTYDRLKILYEAGETSKANLDNAETQYLVNKRNYESAKDVMYVKAPYDGTITGVMVNKGDGVKSETALFTIANLSKMKVKVLVTESEINLISIGDNAIIKYLDIETKGTVTEKDLSMNPATQAFGVTIVFDNNAKIPAGVTGDVLIETYSNPQAIVVPRNLVQQSANEKYVYVAVDEKGVKKTITTGKEYGIEVEVLDGLLPNDRLIVKGSDKVTDGVKLNVIK